MQFVKDGPDIPEHLLEAHEDGHVVFFCGAGISYPAGLPGFEGLVKKLYARLGVIPRCRATGRHRRQAVRHRNRTAREDAHRWSRTGPGDAEQDPEAKED